MGLEIGELSTILRAVPSWSRHVVFTDIKCRQSHRIRGESWMLRLLSLVSRYLTAITSAYSFLALSAFAARRAQKASVAVEKVAEDYISLIPDERRNGVHAVAAKVEVELASSEGLIQRDFQAISDPANTPLIVESAISSPYVFENCLHSISIKCDSDL